MADADPPAWLLRPLPAHAAADDALHQRLDALGRDLPRNLGAITLALDAVKPYREYDAAANRAAVLVWAAREPFLATPADRLLLLSFAAAHLSAGAQARLCRRLAKDPVGRVRARVRRLIARARFREVALPRTADGDWTADGWTHGTGGAPLTRHAQGRQVQARHGLPELPDLAAVRALLGIRSERQFGYFLLASDRDGGPYTKFTVPKRGGGDREICAPAPQLRWVQRVLLDKLLALVPAHDAAHGFVPGRSTVTNAAPHRRAAVLLKFDLVDFFPTIHYLRVVGLFARLGYVAAGARFAARDGSTQVAPALARLCCYTPDPGAWGSAALPQGAPTSPAISNLVCRRLDARLTGLAARNGGVYTRYADDLTFSFPAPGANLGRFRWWVDQVCHQEGFFVHQGKFRVIRASQRQLVTGVVVNDTLRVPRDRRRRFRAILHNCRAHGVAHEARGNPRFPDYLRGFASYVHMVHPEEGADLLRQVDALLGPAPDVPDAPEVPEGEP